MKKVLYEAKKTINKVEKIENPLYTKKILLSPFEAEMLLNKGVNVYEEIVEFKDGLKRVYFIYCNINKLAEIAQ